MPAVAGLGSVAAHHRQIADPASILANEGAPAQGAPAMETPTTPPPAALKPSEPLPFTEVRFVKNIHPQEKITFKDGKSTFRFPKPLFVCKDKELADKILEVADQYNIVIQ